MDRTTKVCYWWRHLGITRRLIVINFACLIIGFVAEFFISVSSIDKWVGLSPDYYHFWKAPWGIFSYTWRHVTLWHFAVNMIWLFWLGRIFLRYHSKEKLLTLYLIGGVMGGLFYILTYQLFSLTSFAILAKPLVGSSAAVMAIVFGIAFYAKGERVQIPFAGRLKLSHIAITLLILDLLMLGSGQNNYGGHIAHLGGAFTGILWAVVLRQWKKDFTTPFIRLTNYISSFSPRSRRRKAKRTAWAVTIKSDIEHNTSEREDDIEQIDQILDKIRQSGYESLTKEEKQLLFKSSRENAGRKRDA